MFAADREMVWHAPASFSEAAGEPKRMLDRQNGGFPAWQPRRRTLRRSRTTRVLAARRIGRGVDALVAQRRAGNDEKYTEGQR